MKFRHCRGGTSCIIQSVAESTISSSNTLLQISLLWRCSKSSIVISSCTFMCIGSQWCYSSSVSVRLDRRRRTMFITHETKRLFIFFNLLFTVNLSFVYVMVDCGRVYRRCFPDIHSAVSTFLIVLKQIVIDGHWSANNWCLLDTFSSVSLGYFVKYNSWLEWMAGD